MAEDLSIRSGTKEEKYLSLLPQLKALTSGETDLTANLANITAALKEQFGWLWTGFYLVRGDELVLGPFQGPVACTRIARGRGVCGAAWARKETILVPDVSKFPGHIACSSRSRSEIVVPALRDGEVVAVLDIDSELPGDFDETDRRYLRAIVEGVEFGRE
ncbi:MAG TPA: GAF domain-containing protein [Elusimicrobiales bacterium]|nr:GAF domain-containing protein [Elusimicrobiales bacterium]